MVPVSINDVLSIIGELKDWKRLKDLPKKVDELEAKIIALEAKLSRKPGKECPSCGALDFRVKSTKEHEELGDLGVMERTMECQTCEFTEKSVVTP